MKNFSSKTLFDNNSFFIHTFKTNNNYYFYDANTNRIVLIDKSTYSQLVNSSKTDSMNSDLFLKMKNNGFLKSNKISYILHSATHTLPYQLENKLEKLCLQVTQQCNFRCEYCAYSGEYKNRRHSSRRMHFSLAKKCIDFFISHSKDTKSINIGFYGGEPLLEFDLIKKCVEYAKLRSEGKELTFSITTNGSLLDDKKFYYLSQNKFSSFLISLDGPKEIHDKHRRFISGKGTFDKIINNLLLIKKKYPDSFQKLSFNSVLDPANSFSCVNDFFIKFDDLFNDQLPIQGSVINHLYSDKQLAFTNTYTLEYKYEYFKALLSLFKKIDKKFISPILINTIAGLREHYDFLRKPSNTVPEEAHPGGPCIPGRSKVFVNTEGDFFPCERVSEESKMMHIGNIDEGFNIERILSLLNIGKTTQDLCKNCWAFRFCTLCAAYSDAIDSISEKMRRQECNGVRSSVESDLITYCTLIEHGYSFDRRNWKEKFHLQPT